MQIIKSGGKFLSLDRAYRSGILLVALISFVLVPFLDAANAQRRGGRLPLIRDAEIEALIQDYTRAVFDAAGLRGRSVEVFILNRNQFNAFVTGSRMFINTGTIMQATTPNEVIGVFAHEAGHIVGGHLGRMRDRLEKAQLLSVLGLLAGAGIAASGNTAAGAAVATGSGSAVQRSFLSYQRGEEIAADRTAVTLLNKTGQSSKGMLKTFERLGQNPLFSSGRLDPYALSHPLPRERVQRLKAIAEESPYFNKKDPASLQLRHELARAKIAAYSGGAGMVRSIFRKNINGPGALYGTAISHYLGGSAKQGIKMMDRLIRQAPKNPYFHEMKGEMLLRSGKAAAAVKSFKQAVALDRYESGLLRIQLGHALLETNTDKNLNAAIKTLKAGIGRDKYSANGYAFLARAYARSGNQVLAIAASAEENYLKGNIKEAKQFAKRAEPHLARGSPQWLRIQDILNFKK